LYGTIGQRRDGNEDSVKTTQSDKSKQANYSRTEINGTDPEVILQMEREREVYMKQSIHAIIVQRGGGERNRDGIYMKQGEPSTPRIDIIGEKSTRG
jgi:hypothetical protein